MKAYILVEFIIVSNLYISILKNNKSSQFIVLSICSYLIYWIYSFYKSSFTEFEFKPLVVECFFFTILIVYYFYDLMRNNFTIPLYRMPVFWLSVAFLIYFSGNFFLFLYSDVIRTDPNWGNQFTVIYSTIALLKNGLLCTAIIVNKNSMQQEENISIPSNLNLDDFKPLNKSINS
jgi:hypothetical protein